MVPTLKLLAERCIPSGNGVPPWVLATDILVCCDVGLTDLPINEAAAELELDVVFFTFLDLVPFIFGTIGENGDCDDKYRAYSDPYICIRGGWMTACSGESVNLDSGDTF